MKLSVVILSYNVSDLLKQAINSVLTTFNEFRPQVIVVDNASSDNSTRMVKENFPKVDLVVSKINTGFSAGNNLAREKTRGDYVLFLNPDTIVKGNAISKCLEILSSHDEIGAITCKVVLPNDKLDYSCHRGLPTIWNTFCYWIGLAKIFPTVKFFSGYTAGYLNVNESHYVDCISGTFLMIKRDLLEEINWWDEDYWWNGDDIEMCYQIRKHGYKIWYEASEETVHYKGSSSGLWKTGKAVVSKETKLNAAKSAARAMRIFVGKHANDLGPWPVVQVAKFGIFLLEKYRLWKIEKGLTYA